MRQSWNKQQIDYLLANYKTQSLKSIANHIGCPIFSVYHKMNNLGIKQELYKEYSKDDDFIINNSYSFLSNVEIGKIIGRSADSVKNRISLLGLKREQIDLKKISDRLSSPTRFKKGNLPKNTLFDFAESIRHKKGYPPYVYIRLAKGKWVFKNRYLWEKQNGPIPDGMVLACKTKDTTNCDPRNWEMISKEQNMLRNSIQNFPPELKETIQLLSRLKRKLKKHGQEQDN